MKPTKGSITVFLQCGDLGEDIEAKIEYTYTEGYPERQYLPNGDPGYPAEPADVEIDSMFIVDWGVSVPSDTLTESTYDMIYDMIVEQERN